MPKSFTGLSHEHDHGQHEKHGGALHPAKENTAGGKSIDFLNQVIERSLLVGHFSVAAFTCLINKRGASSEASPISAFR